MLRRFKHTESPHFIVDSCKATHKDQKPSIITLPRHAVISYGNFATLKATASQKHSHLVLICSSHPFVYVHSPLLSYLLLFLSFVKVRVGFALCALFELCVSVPIAHFIKVVFDMPIVILMSCPQFEYQQTPRRCVQQGRVFAGYSACFAFVVLTFDVQYYIL